MDLTEGMLLHDRYRIVGMLGQGGMGAVYEALDTSLETRVAVKTNFSTTQNSVNQFLKEARLLASLRHPNLPRVTDYFVIEREQYLVMDFVDGSDLNQRLKTEGAISVRDALAWAKKLSDALSYLHSQNPPVIHRDIKPANIKITPEGQLYLVDFGIAKASGTSQETESGASGYTPGFAPPEQYGKGRTGPFSDQFSLAATLYTLLTAVKPVDSIERLLGKSTLVPVHQLNKNVPDNFADAIQIGLNLQPEDRFVSVGEFMAAIQNPEFRQPRSENRVMNIDLTQKPLAQSEKIANSEPKVTTVKPIIKKRRGLVIGVVSGGIVLCVAIIAILVGVFAKNGFSLDFLKAGLITLQPNETPQRETSAIHQVEVTPLPTSEPVITTEEALIRTPTLTTQVTQETNPASETTQTEAIELVGGSGRIVFVSDRGDGVTTQIWTMRVVKSMTGEISVDELTQLTFETGNKEDPVWSPDGAHIAFSAPGPASNGSDIWVMNADGSGIHNITHYPGDEFDPIWSPDGAQIVFTAHTRDEGSKKILQLFRLTPEGFNRERISKEFVEFQPAFTPDGNYLVYVIQATGHEYFFIRNRFDNFEEPQKFDVREIFGSLGETGYPEFSPDGRSMVYTELDGDNQKLVLLTFDKLDSFGARGIQTRDIGTTHNDFNAAWSLDNNWLAFTSTRDDGNIEVYLTDLNGQVQTNLTNHPGIDRSPDWLPIQ